MVEKTVRSRIETDERASETPQWEVFVRDEEDGPLSYVGSVVASNGETAHERASRLFGWYAADVWLCPTAEVVQYSARGREDGSENAGGAEPRVYEETEGTPGVGDPSSRT